MKIKFITIFLISIAIFISCVDHTLNRATSILENSSGHRIQILYYKNNKIDNSREVNLDVGEAEKVLIDDDGGTLNYPTLISELDSAVVIYDGTRRGIHYGYNKMGNNPNAIFFSNSKNLFNGKNYVENITLREKKRTEREYKYTFTEQDYLNAK
jgi:hypothetical protein